MAYVTVVALRLFKRSRKEVLGNLAQLASLREWAPAFGNCPDKRISPVGALAPLGKCHTSMR